MYPFHVAVQEGTLYLWCLRVSCQHAAAPDTLISNGLEPEETERNGRGSRACGVRTEHVRNTLLSIWT